MKDILRLGVTLALVCAVAAGGLALTYAATKDEIVRQIKEQQEKAMREVLPGISNPVFKNRADLVKSVKDKLPLVAQISDTYSGDSKAVRVIQVAPRGYGGFLNMVVGIETDGRVLGVSIISHNETPGLGSGITEGSFLKQFKGKDPSAKLEVNKGIDAISGATKSSKAVTRGVKEALEAFKETEGK